MMMTGVTTATWTLAAVEVTVKRPKQRLGRMMEAARVGRRKMQTMMMRMTAI
jgi:hypothetical protein